MSVFDAEEYNFYVDSRVFPSALGENSDIALSYFSKRNSRYNGGLNSASLFSTGIRSILKLSGGSMWRRALLVSVPVVDRFAGGCTK